jgi:methionyl aminopeptidase
MAPKVDAPRAAAAAMCVVKTHEHLASFIREGMTLAQIDAEVARTLASLHCKSCFLGYKIPRTPPFPCHACLSVNECVVHGTVASFAQPLSEGDILSIDIGVKHDGWIGDAAWTYAIKSRPDQAAALMDCGIESLRRGVAAMQPGAQLVEFARAVQGYVEDECKVHLTRGLGGHGIGRKLHTPPFVSNTLPRLPSEWPDATRSWSPGTLVAVEPMISVGTGQTRSEPGTWPIYAADNSLSVHYEADVLITDEGPRNLTEQMYNLPDIVG